MADDEEARFMDADDDLTTTTAHKAPPSNFDQKATENESNMEYQVCILFAGAEYSVYKISFRKSEFFHLRTTWSILSIVLDNEPVYNLKTTIIYKKIDYWFHPLTSNLAMIAENPIRY